MIICNETKTKVIEMIHLESETANYPSRRVSVRIITENIEARFAHGIWLSDSEIVPFILALDSLERTRRGEAVLESMTPAELRISFRSIDNLGHISVGLDIGKEDYAADDHRHRIQIQFQIDPTTLSSISKDFSALLTGDPGA